MKLIYRIAKVELKTLFYSPIAWFVLIIFTFQTGLLYTDLMKGYLQKTEAGIPLGKLLGGLTLATFGTSWSLFPNVQNTLFLYVPLLSMGLISREVSSGSIKLLLSSPVKMRQIVLGKYLALMGYCFLLMLILLMFIITANISIVHMDRGMVLSGLLGTYLLISAYSAIGLFMSSLTSYQVVAAISTLVVLTALNYLGGVGQNIAFIRTLTYFLTLWKHTYMFTGGLITSENLIYFLIVIAFFLGITVMRLNDGRELRPRLVKAGRYILLIAALLIVGYLSSRPLLTAYFDVTASKSQTLSENTRNIIKKIKGTIKVTAYSNLLDRNFTLGAPEKRNDDMDFWQPYLRFMPATQFEYVSYYDTSKSYLFRMKANVGLNLKQLAKKVADAQSYDMDMFLTPSEMKKRIDLEPEEHRFVRQLELGNKKTFLRVFDDPNPEPGEREIAAALKRLTQTPPKLAFLYGHFERSTGKEDANSYQRLTISRGTRAALVNQGFDVDTLDIENQEIPKEVTALIIADPIAAFKPGDLEKIGRWLDKGGNMVIAGEPGRQVILNPLLSNLGVRLMDGVLIAQNEKFGPDYIKADFSKSAGNIFDTENLKAFGEDSLQKVIMSGAVGLEYKDNGDYQVIPVVVTNSQNTWNKAGAFSMDTGKVTYNPEHGDIKGTIPLALALTRKTAGREQRIMVLGDADFMNRSYMNTGGNMAFIVETFKWLSYGALPVNTAPGKTSDNDFRATRSDVTTVKLIFLGIIPGILLIGGTVLLIRRKRK